MSANYANKPQSRLRRGLVRLLKVSGLSLLITLIVIVSLALETAQYYLVDPQVTSVELYHRTWQAVRDNYFDESKLENWDDWEHKYDHLIKTDEDAIRYARIMVRSLNDPYTYLLAPPEVMRTFNHAFGKTISVGILMTPALSEDGRPRLDQLGRQLPEVDEDGLPVVFTVVRGGPAHAAGISPGDVLVTIDGRPVKDMPLDEIHRRLTGELGSTVSLGMLRDGAQVSLQLTMQPVEVPVVSSRRLPNGIAYVRVESFSQLNTADQLEAELAGLTDCTGYVIDMRDNPGGLIHVAVEAASLFLDEGVIATKRTRVPVLGFVEIKSELGESVLWVNAGGVPIPMPRRPNLTGDKPVVVLVNGGTASAAEMFTAALAENGRAYVVGTRTFGKGIGQTLIPVGNGARLRITNLYSYTPKGNWLGDAGMTVANGINPDMTIAAPANLLYASRNDNQLKAAIEHIRKATP